MSLKLAKVLFSTALLGSTIGGGSYGIYELSLKRQSKNLKQEKSTGFDAFSGEDSSKRREKELEVPKESLTDSKEDKSLEEQQDNPVVDVSRSPLVSVEDEKLTIPSDKTEKVYENENDYWTSSEGLKQLETQEELSESEELNLEKEVLSEDTEHEEIETEEERTLRLQKEEIERKEQNLSLEAVWIVREVSVTYPKKMCISFKKGWEGELPVIINEEEEGASCNDDMDIYNTSWSEDKKLGSYAEGLWIRGESKKVEALVDVNWEDIVNSGFIKQDKKHLKTSEEKVKEFKKVCQIVEKNNTEDWLEMSCLR